MKKTIALLTISLLLSIMSSCSSESETHESVEAEKVIDYSSLKLNNIESIDIKDVSIKALGDKSLSDFTPIELGKEPTNKRLNCRLVISQDFKEEDTEPTINDLIKKIQSIDPDIDELSIYIYSDKSLTNGAFDIAMASWLPKSGEVSPEIAKNNDHSTYETTITLKENLSEYLQMKNSVEVKFGLSQEIRQQIYSMLVKSETKAREEADKLFPPSTEVEKNVDMNNKLMLEYKEEIRKEYNITEDTEWAIVEEGMKKGWKI